MSPPLPPPWPSGHPAASACWTGERSEESPSCTPTMCTLTSTSRAPELTYAAIAALKQSYQDAGKNVLLVDAGDHVQGTAYGSMDEGASIIELMNAAGYDAATPGNHEFDYGMDRAKELMRGCGLPVPVLQLGGPAHAICGCCRKSRCSCSGGCAHCLCGHHHARDLYQVHPGLLHGQGPDQATSTTSWAVRTARSCYERRAEGH